jgi:hypothetical protein
MRLMTFLDPGAFLGTYLVRLPTSGLARITSVCAIIDTEAQVGV